MMERAFIKSQVAKLKKAYEKFDIDQTQFDLWCECFKDCNPKIFEQAVLSYIKDNRFTPTIAGVMEEYKAIADSRAEIINMIIRQYMIMHTTWEEPADEETMKLFAKKVCAYPKDEWITKAVDITHEAVSFYHDCIIEGKPLPTIKEWLGGKA